MIRQLFHKMQIVLANRSFSSKIRYLRKEGCKIGEGTRLICSVESIGTEPYLVSIGDNCLFSTEIMFCTHDGGVKVLNSLGYFSQRHDKMGCIKIGNNCFIGHRVIILPNVSIGDNCIIGSGAVVTKNIPANSVCAGIPAKVVCSIDEYYNKNVNRFFPTPALSKKDKRHYLTQHFFNDKEEKI